MKVRKRPQKISAATGKVTAILNDLDMPGHGLADYERVLYTNASAARHGCGCQRDNDPGDALPAA